MQEQALAKEDKLILRQVEVMDTLIRQDGDETKRHAKRQVAREKAEREERERQENVGEVVKAKVVGRFKYKQRKTDF